MSIDQDPSLAASIAVASRSSLSWSSLRRSRASNWRRRALEAVRAIEAKVVGWKGRSRKVTFPSASASRAAEGLLSGPPPFCVRTMIGKSDQGGWALIQACIRPMSVLRIASSERTTKVTPAPSSAASASRSGQAAAGMPASCKSATASVASRPCGAKTSALSWRVLLGMALLAYVCRRFWLYAANEIWHSAEHALEFLKRFAERQSVLADRILADCIFMLPGAFLDD